MSDLRDQIASATRAKAHAFIKELGRPIDLRVAACPNYSALLRGEHGAPVDRRELLNWATSRGRVILAGRGASGKSALLHRVAIEAADSGIAPFLLHLSRWDHAATAGWRKVQDSPRESMDFLLASFGASEHDITDVEFLPVDVTKIFLLDGLNETPGSTADEILQVCDQIAALLIGASLIVTDRLVRRNLTNENRWRFAMPLPVEGPEVERLLEGCDIPAGAEGLLPSPFFLDRAMRGELRASPLATIRELVEKRGRLDPEGLSAASLVAFKAYEQDRSRTFRCGHFFDLGRENDLKTLLAGGILVPVDDMHVAFFHHWYHDYLASKHVAENPSLWNFENRHHVLDALTFKANSFDTIGFALELLTPAASVDFLQAVYDWNPYAAGYALAEAAVKQDDVSFDVRAIILAMLAEKRFDRHYYSARRAADALDLQKDDQAARIRSVSHLDQLFAVIASIDSPRAAFTQWRDLFIAREATGSMIEALTSDDAVIGWTSANVLKRLPLTPDQLAMIGDTVDNLRPVVRWRAVHVLGGFAIDEFVSLLLKSLRDDDENVRYGAMRSLIELASRDEARLPNIVDDIVERLRFIKADPRVLGELERAVFLSAGVAPPNWSSEISRIFYALLDDAQDAGDAEHWSKLASRLRIHHRPDAERAA